MEEKKSRKKPKVRKGRAHKEASPHHSMEINSNAKVMVLDEYWNYDSMRMMPITNATMERLIEQGILWARTDPDAIKINQFLDKNSIPRNTWDKWREKHEIIRAGNEVILSILGNKRELGLLTRKYEPGSTISMMPHYDSDWKKIVEWKAGLSNKAEATGGTQFVVIPECPRSSLVPDRKKDE